MYFIAFWSCLLTICTCCTPNTIYSIDESDATQGGMNETYSAALTAYMFRSGYSRSGRSKAKGKYRGLLAEREGSAP